MRRVLSFEFLIVVVVAGLVAWVVIQRYTEKEMYIEDRLIENMKILNEALDEYKSLSGGFLPSRLNIPVSAITGDTLLEISVTGKFDPARAQDIHDDTTALLHQKMFENPYNSRAIAVMTIRDTLEITQPGVIYYLPEGIIGDRGMKSRIFAMGRRGILPFEISNHSDRF